GASAAEALVAAALELAAPGHGTPLATLQRIVAASNAGGVQANTAFAAVLAGVPAPIPAPTPAHLAVAELALTVRFTAGPAAALQANGVTAAVPVALNAVLPPGGAMTPLGAGSVAALVPIVTQAATPGVTWPAPAA